MKLIELIEARRNPAVNNVRNGPDTVKSYLKTLSPEVLKRTVVSGQDINKLGINFTNPLQAGDHNAYRHIAGIYAWPARSFKNWVESGDIGYLRKHLYVFEINPRKMLRSDHQNFIPIIQKAFPDNKPRDHKYKSNKFIRKMGYESVYVLPGEDNKYFDIDQGAIVVLSSKFCHNIKVFAGEPEHVDLDPDWERGPYRERGADSLIKLAASRPLTAQQEQIIVDHDSISDYLRMLVKLGRPPTNRKIVDNFIMESLDQLAYDISSDIRRDPNRTRESNKSYSFMLSVIALVHPNPKQFLDPLIDKSTRTL